MDLSLNDDLLPRRRGPFAVLDGVLPREQRNALETSSIGPQGADLGQAVDTSVRFCSHSGCVTISLGLGKNRKDEVLDLRSKRPLRHDRGYFWDAGRVVRYALVSSKVL